MALKGVLRIDGKALEYEILECEYEFVQPIKENGQPAGRPGGGLIHFTALSPYDGDMLFHEWMMNKTEHKDGEIVFEVVDSAKIETKTLHFKQAYCIRLYEYFNAHSSLQMYVKITISASEISFGKGCSVVFKNDSR